MPPHLHPRSTWTTSLFTSTLAISFLVVGAPHLLPCPVQPRAFADSEMPTDQRKRRRKRCLDGPREESTAEQCEGGERKRECPVPKPRGLVGQILGFERKDGPDARLPVVQIERLSDSRLRRQNEDER